MALWAFVWLCNLTCLILLIDFGASKAVAKPNIILLFADDVSYCIINFRVFIHKAFADITFILCN